MGRRYDNEPWHFERLAAAKGSACPVREPRISPDAVRRARRLSRLRIQQTLVLRRLESSSRAMAGEAGPAARRTGEA